MLPACILDAAESRIWRLFQSTRGLSPVDWAAEHLRLDAHDNAQPGRWNPALTPYLRGPMEALVAPGVRVVVVLKAARIGWSLALRGVAGFLIDCDPGPQLWLQPDIDSAREFFRDELVPLVTGTPALADYLTGQLSDVSSRRIRLTSCRIYAAWATSPNTVRRRTIRYAFCEEPGGYPDQGREGDVVALAEKRLLTFGDRGRMALGSTPTTRAGVVWRQWERCQVQLDWHVPCPHCSAFGVLRWDQFRWPKGATPDQIDSDGLAWYECADCRGRVEYAHLSAMNARGVWGVAGQVARDGAVTGLTTARRVGFRIPAVFSPFYPWGQLVADWLRAQGNPELLRVFTNTALAETFEQSSETASASDLESKRAAGGHRPGEVPDWCGLLLATVDTQRSHFVWVVRAWGPRERSRLVAYGFAHSFEDLAGRLFATGWSTATNHAVSVRLCVIDSGGTRNEYSESRTEQVYRWAATDPDRILPAKGSGDRKPDGRTHWLGLSGRGPAHAPALRLLRFKPDLYKDRLARRIADHRPDAPDLWEVHSEIDETYVRQMTAEHRVVLPKLGYETWERRTDGACNDLWDCEVLQTVGADYCRVQSLPANTSVASSAEHRERQTHRPLRPRRPSTESSTDRIAARMGLEC